MAIAPAELQNLPPLEETMRAHKLAIGDVAMFAALNPDKRDQSPWVEMRSVLEPYIAAGILATEQVVEPRLSIVK